MFSCVLALKSLIINEVSFSGIGSVIGSSEGFSERGRVRERGDSRRGCIPASFPVVAWVLGAKSLTINGILLSITGFRIWDNSA